MSGFHNALRNFRDGNLDVFDAGTLAGVVEAVIQRTGARRNVAESVGNHLTQSAYGDLPGHADPGHQRSSTPLIRLHRTQWENQAPQVLVWGINWEEHLFNKKILQ